MDNLNLRKMMDSVSRMDSTITLKDISTSDFVNRRIEPTKYKRRRLFKNLASGVPSLFIDYETPLHLQKISTSDAEDLVISFLSNLDLDREFRVFSELGSPLTRKTISEIMNVWHKELETQRITDLHIRNTPITSIINADSLSRFNLLPGNDRLVSSLEMMTLMISTKGSITDSHSDDADVSNHCFTGKKFWLAWETQEGLNAGLEDCEKMVVYGKPDFSMQRFMELESSCWFLVEPGNTLFLPGHLTHKVITVEKYIGVGGFAVSLPSILRSLTRWMLTEPLFSTRDGKDIGEKRFEQIISLAIQKISQLQITDELTQKQWGFDYLEYARQKWEQSFTHDTKESLLANEKIRLFLELSGSHIERGSLI